MRYFNLMMRSLIVGLGCILLTACTTDLRPMGYLMKQMPKVAPVEYQLGWKEGCESGIAAMSNDFFRAFYRYTQSVELVHNEVYYKAWKDSFNYCRSYAYGMVREFGVRYKLPRDEPNLIINADETNPWGAPILSGDIQGLGGIYPVSPDDGMFGNLRDPIFRALGP